MNGIKKQTKTPRNTKRKTGLRAREMEDLKTAMRNINKASQGDVSQITFINPKVAFIVMAWVVDKKNVDFVHFTPNASGSITCIFKFTE